MTALRLAITCTRHPEVEITLFRPSQCLCTPSPTRQLKGADGSYLPVQCEMKSRNKSCWSSTDHDWEQSTTKGPLLAVAVQSTMRGCTPR
jgi:hypothetical protein